VWDEDNENHGVNWSDGDNKSGLDWVRGLRR
jgi:hypothetical protein